MSRQRNEQEITDELFCAIWTSARNRQEVSEKTGMSVGNASARANKLRKQGAKLKKMKRVNTKKIDVVALNRLIKEVEKEKMPPGEVNDEFIKQCIQKYMKK